MRKHTYFQSFNLSIFNSLFAKLLQNFSTKMGGDAEKKLIPVVIQLPYVKR